MAIFRLSEDESRRFAEFTGDVNSLASELESYGEERDARELRRLADTFSRKVKDFFYNERRLNIGIVGRVKAGKSSFLNTLLFDGRSVLPKASTPKTANLTKIEYVEENAMEVEYYSTEDWQIIEDNAKTDLDEAVYE